MGKQTLNLAVNWIDGMKINKDHFIATDLNLSRHLLNVYQTIVNPYNYGLLLQNRYKKQALNVVIDIDSQAYVHAKVFTCSAITKGGVRIEIDEAHFADSELAAELPSASISKDELNNNEYYLALTIDTSKRVPFGIADPEEQPPRLPYVIPGINLSIHKSNELESIKSANSLLIGRLIYVDEKPQLDEDYIPPCQTIFSHPKLAEYHAQLVKILGQIEIDLINILKRIKEKKQSTSIAITVADVIDSLLLYMSVHLVEFRRMARYYPPVYIFEHMSAIARNVSNAINKQATADREELLNYIQDWSNLKQGEFEELIAKAIEYYYDHDDINKSINHLAPFVNAISKVTNTLSNLDFIGKKKDRQIFVKEQKENPGSSFLVD